MILKVKVIPNSSKSQIVGFENDVLKIKCLQVPEKGKVNQEVIKLLSEFYKVPKKNIKLLKGLTHTSKVFEVILDEASSDAR